MPGKDDSSTVVNQEHTKEEIEETERYEDRVKDAILGVADEEDEEDEEDDEEDEDEEK